jgi:hypothetical protein
MRRCSFVNATDRMIAPLVAVARVRATPGDRHGSTTDPYRENFTAFFFIERGALSSAIRRQLQGGMIFHEPRKTRPLVDPSLMRNSIPAPLRKEFVNMTAISKEL